MPLARVLWEAHVRRFQDAMDRYKQGRLSAEEAGELLGLSGRHFRRQCARYETEGEDGLRDKRVGLVSHRRAPESELERMRRLYRPVGRIEPRWRIWRLTCHRSSLPGGCRLPGS